jgi:dihydrolipoamide dehydrogenase
MADQVFDVIVIGGGPGGYVAAIRAAQLGFNTACVERSPTLGGTCLNVGCIPSKALLHSSEIFEEAGHSFAQHGIEVAAPKLDLQKMMARKDKVVQDNVNGVAYLFRKNKVTWVKGLGRLGGSGSVLVRGEDGTEKSLAASHIIIATGSESTPLPGAEIDEEKIVSSTGALALKSVPKTMAVIGAGYIGLEMGTVWRRLGTEVTVVEVLDRVLPGMDSDIAKQAQRIFAKQGMKFRLATKVTEVKKGKTAVTLKLAPATGGDTENLTVDVVLVAIGRRPLTGGLDLEKAGVKLDERGRIAIDKDFRTSAAGIYAIGDVVAGPMLAHKAEDEGIACAEIIARQKPEINYDAIPGVVYTGPEIASVGKTEDQLKAAGTAYKIGKFPFSANARARVNAETEGQVKILADAATDRILGAHVIGPDAGTLIQELVLAIEFGASAEDIALTSHAHPTLTEAVREAALAVEGRAIHI